MSSSRATSDVLPRLPVDLAQNKLPIALYWLPIVLTSCILPIVGYFSMRYATNMELTIILSIWLSIMGASSLGAYLMRSWALFRRDSTCRPLGLESRWTFDYFFWNFTFTFCLLTALITSGIVTENLTIVSLPLSILMLWVGLQMILAEVLLSFNVRVPFRISSLKKGDSLRPGIFVIVDDVVAVDGKQGRTWRHAWNDRYLASPDLRKFLSKMDRLWGSTALAVVAVIWGVVFGVDNPEIGYTIGWALPFVWGAIMAVLTTVLAKRMLAKEKAGGADVAAAKA